MANVYIEARPKGRPEGTPIEDFVVEDHKDHALATFKTQHEAIEWAKKEGHMSIIYCFRGLFFTSDDFGLNGPYEGFNEAAEAVGLLTVTETTEEIWVDFRVNPNSGLLNNLIN